MQPPKKNSKPIPDNVKKLDNWLTSIIAGYPNATTTYTFYEEIDKYLGPWGNGGYPIAYGKKYNILFTTNAKLNANPTTKMWVRKTTIFLQESLKKFILTKYINNQLSTLSERELRQAAFDSHPRAYTKGGLTIVLLTAPELIDDIARIPVKEFYPMSPNFRPSVRQAFTTASIVAPEATGTLIAASMPAHSGLFRHAAAKDRMRFTTEIQLNNYLISLKKAIKNGDLDLISTLDEITNKLELTQFPNQEMSQEAKKVIIMANNRKKFLARKYRNEVQNDEELRQMYNKTFLDWSNW